MPSIRLLLLVLCIAPCAHAQQVYKWVDAQGRTHYSTTKPDAANTKASEVNIKSPPPDPQDAARARAATQEAARTQNPVDATVPGTPSPARKPGWEYSDKPETNESRCALARAIVSGDARRIGAKTDQNDRDVAQNDIKAFCR